MAGLGMAILGGALEQVGTGIADRGKALREAKLKELEQEREFQFRSSQAGVSEDRADARALANDQRQAAENDKNRAVQGTQYGTAEDGSSVMIRDGKATPVTGADGKPVKLATKAGDAPADQQMVEYLMKIGKTQEEALDWVKTSRGKSEEDSKLALYRAHVAAGLSTEEANQATEEAWAKYGKSSAAADPYAGDRTAPAGPSKVTKDKPGALRAPPGDGSEHRPFKASQQADVDWFKKYAKPGQMIEYGGTIYTK